MKLLAAVLLVSFLSSCSLDLEYRYNRGNETDTTTAHPFKHPNGLNK
jgi:uncharacterized lipoprotein